MAIDPIKKVTILSPRQSNNRLMKTINRLGVMEVTDLKDIDESKEPSLQRAMRARKRWMKSFTRSTSSSTS